METRCADVMTDRTVNYDTLLARENQERINKALFELDMQKTRDQYSPTAIRRILEGGTA
jgi:hypothetical protein